MIVYVETNFVLEIAFLQGEYQSCESIMTLAELDLIGLVVPAFSIAESYETLIRREHRRRSAQETLIREIRELSRAEPNALIRELWDPVSEKLRESVSEEKTRLDATLDRILRCATSIGTEAQTVQGAVEFQFEHFLSVQDSIIYASVLGHMASAIPQPSCFLNRNSRDFATADIRAQLEIYNCRLISSFDDGLNFIQNALR